MGITQYYLASSIDGFLAESDGGLDWLLQFEGFEGQSEAYQEFYQGVGAIVMGADTYRFVLEEMPGGWPYPGLPCWVFSNHELPGYQGEDIRFVSGEVSEIAREASSAAGQRNVWLLGGGQLAGQFQRAGLIDELILTIVPVLLGSGRPIMPLSQSSPELQLLGQRQFGRGIIELRYRLKESSHSVV
ncbi:dihydrofolate reductase family protein [Psychromicrobium lacuslunae]|uniref:Deaminase n=1 Tax=Psychromicrobium lacuslunae TaxID=1618207 RepID=A0A0D4BWY5_9MICC|nr:dihydrofolate reductase family protein [Psychromicrobium lacuslunae]AJT40833.1 deaminase [Psychromicrobium lacuslunae]